jgi:hypothetical protein
MSESGNGVRFLGLLQIVFITLKLTHVIDWSWWWVLSPIWIPLILVLFGFCILLSYEYMKEEYK